MQFPKTKRIVDPDVIDLVKSVRCMVCLKPPPGDAHHVTTVGAGGDDVLSNLMNLCRDHHQEVHRIGYGEMISRYPVVLRWLEKYKRTDVIERINRSNSHVSKSSTD